MAASSIPKPTVGILYCGELGTAFGKLLRQGGLRVVTTCQDRSRATYERALSSGINILPTLADVAAQSHFVFSFVLPLAAVDVARQYLRCSCLRPQHGIFVEGNSIGLQAMEEIKSLMAVQNVPLVDAAVNGGANRLEDLGVLHVSGPRVGEVEGLCHGLMRVNPLGEYIGSASCLKLLISGIAKGLPALFLETSVLAERAGMSEAFLQGCCQFYPDLMKMIERTLITYPRHACRRVGEIANVEQMGRAMNLRLGMTREAGELTRLAASVDWEQIVSRGPVDLRAILQAVSKAFPVEDGSPALLEVPHGTE